MIEESAILSALGPRAEEFTLQVWPGSRSDPASKCLWVNDTLRIYTSGIRAGRWRDADGNEGDLLELYTESAGITHEEAVQKVAIFLGLAEEGPAPELPAEEADPPVYIPPEERDEPAPHEKPRRKKERRKESEVEERVLPQSADAEMGLIGSILVDPPAVLALCEDKGVVPGYFYGPAMSMIYQVILGIHHSGVPVDFILLTKHLNDLDYLEQVGGPAFVTSLFTFVPTAANAGHYIDILREKFIRRQIILECDKRSRSAYEDGSDDPAQLVEGLQETLKSLTAAARSRDLYEVTESTFEELMRFDSRNDPNCLLGNRWLCKGGAILWIGQAGLGKSSLIMQAAMKWGFGSDLFGIAPASGRELKSLIIQAENDEGDLAEMAQGVLHAMMAKVGDRATRADLIQCFQEQIKFARDTVHTGRDFARVLRKLIVKYKPDLVWMDPLLSYAGGDISRQEVASEFLRNQLNPVLLDHGVGLMVAHHTGKPSTDPKAKSNWTEHDASYNAFGSSELVNWARGVNILRPLGEGLFELRLGKRGKRAGAKTLGSEFTDVIHMSHSEVGIYWNQAEAPVSPETQERDAGGKFEREYASDDILSAMAEKGKDYAWRVTELQKWTSSRLGLSKATFYRHWNVLTVSGKLAKHSNGAFSLD